MIQGREKAACGPDGESCVSNVSPERQDAPLRRTMAAVVADRLRTMTLHGELPPGERVKVQRLIEPEITARAMQAARPGYGRELRRALRRLSETIDDPGSDRYMREHTAFHWALIEPAASPVMRRVVEQLWQMSERYIRLTVASPETRRTYAQHHEPLVDAMESGDAGRVRAEVVRHLSEAEEIVLGPRHGAGAGT
jgi:DNA-binding GntR family transcriptional regulator